MAGMRREIRDINPTPTAIRTKKQRSTTGEIHNISFETCITRAHCRQLILWKSNRPKPSPNPATIPNHTATENNDLSGVDFPTGSLLENF
jgi:hypothetical protein